MPKIFRFTIYSVLINLFILLMLRVIFYYVFGGYDSDIPYTVILKAFYLGLKFDLRLVLIIHSPIILFGWIKHLHIINSGFGRIFWGLYLTIISLFIFLFYIVDFGHYDYLETRINATIIRFFYDYKRSYMMIVESYPALGILFFLIILILLIEFSVRLLIRKVSKSEISLYSKKKKNIIVFVFLLIYSVGIYGKISYFPLRWSEAFFSPNHFVSSLSLNPVLYFLHTLKNRELKYNKNKVKEYYNEIAEYLDVDIKDKESLNYVRVIDNKKNKAIKPNIIIVFLESFSYFMAGLSGNPLNATPFFDSLSKQSLLFKRFYIPHNGTARSLFAVLTGIPDIELVKTSSRNPLIINQHTIVNTFKEYEKYYFISYSANWGQVRGMLTHNIPGFKIFEEGDYKSPRINVWGISDLDLFKEINKEFKSLNGKPFFAIVQTGGNHGPYTIPDDNRGFKEIEADKKQIKKYGFNSLKELNSLHFMDHCVKYFIETVKKEDYFNNTIFVFFGDHGALGVNADHMHRSEKELDFKRHHVPLIIYAPWLIKKARVFNSVASSVDILPTIAGLVSKPYVNSTLGRDLLDDRFNSMRYAFTILHKHGPSIGLIGERFYYRTHTDGTNERLHDIYSEEPLKNIIKSYPLVVDKMRKLCVGYFEAAKYMRYNNSNKKVELRVKKIKKEQ